MQISLKMIISLRCCSVSVWLVGMFSMVRGSMAEGGCGGEENQR